MTFRMIRCAFVIMTASLATMSASLPAVAEDHVPDHVKRASDPRFDIDRYSRAYSEAMNVLNRFSKKGCVDAADAADRDKWTAYAESLARTLHAFSSRVEYDEPNVDPALSQRREALDMVDQLLGQARTVRGLPACPPPLPETTPGPGPEGSSPPPPVPALKLPKRLLAMWPCASKEEQDTIRDLLAQIGLMKLKIASLEAELAAAQQAFDARNTEDSAATAQLYAILQATKERDQPQLGALNSDMSQLQQKVLDMFDEIKSRGDCPPPGAILPPGPPADGPGTPAPAAAPEKPSLTPKEEPPPKKEGALENILGHVSIGVGVGDGKAGDNHKDRGHADKPTPTYTPPVESTPPHD